jgi:hypothetical protein
VCGGSSSTYGFTGVCTEDFDVNSADPGNMSTGSTNSVPGVWAANYTNHIASDSASKLRRESGGSGSAYFYPSKLLLCNRRCRRAKLAQRNPNSYRCSPAVKRPSRPEQVSFAVAGRCKLCLKRNPKTVVCAKPRPSCPCSPKKVSRHCLRSVLLVSKPR